MSGRDDSGSRLPARVLAILAAAAAMGVLILVLDRTKDRRAAPEQPLAVIIQPASEPIAAEALVFRTTTADLATDPTSSRRRPAHPRTMAMYRALRAYPGAPPRIPHGLTAEEYRLARCTTCHERGGYSPRFEAYAPITPHPELAACLQCHLPDARLAGIGMPGTGPDALCRQCHARPGAEADPPGPSWRSAAWPDVRSARTAGTPPDIPHDLDSRGNCLACHAGPGSVAELRTRHPERPDCRQCHLEAGAAAEFVRPAPPAGATRGGSG